MKTVPLQLASGLAMRCSGVPTSDDFVVCSAEKMRAGIPLTDANRWPWLQVLAELIDQHLSSGRCLVMACSALTEAYRDILRGKHLDDVTFVSTHRFNWGSYNHIYK